MDRQPIPITKQADLPILMHGHLPGPVAAWAKEISRCTGVCPTMVNTLATAVMSSLFQSHFAVEVYPGYVECLANYSAIIAEPGERKTAVMKALMEPIKDYCRQQRHIWSAQKMLAESKAKHAKKKVETLAKEGGSVEEIAKHVAVIEQAEGQKQFVVEDFTSASLAHTMKTNNSILISTDEGEVWKKLGGGYNEDIGLLLRAHTGEPYVRNRKSEDEACVIDRPTASIAISMQPSILASSTAENLSGQGLTARFFIAIPEPKIGKFALKHAAADDNIREGYTQFIQKACSLMENKPEKIKHIHLSDNAMAIYESFASWCAWELRMDGHATPFIVPEDSRVAKMLQPSSGTIGKLGAMRGWGSKLAGACIRIAGLRAVGRLLQYEGAVSYEISSDDMCHAIRYCIQMREHMVAVNQLMRGENWMESQKAIDILNEQGWPKEPIPVGRLANILKECGANRAAVERIIQDLIDKDWLIQVDKRIVRANDRMFPKMQLQLEDGNEN